MTDSERILHIKNLIAIAMADGKLHPMEREFIKGKASLINLSEDEIDILFTEAIALSHKMLSNPSNKEEQLADAVLMSVIDGHIHENEIALINDLGKKLGFSTEYIESLLNRSAAYWDNIQGLSSKG